MGLLILLLALLFFVAVWIVLRAREALPRHHADVACPSCGSVDGFHLRGCDLAPLSEQA